MNKKERIIMSDIFDSRDLLDELKTLKKEKELNKKLNIDVIDYNP